MYDRFAGVYDRLMDDFDYPAWADYYLKILSLAGCSPRAACECACGTGSMTIALAKRGLRMVGCDLSEEMLRRAQEKARAAGVMIPFVHEDMTALTLPRPVEAILCPCDGVNYLTEEKRVRAFFRAALRNLRPGGVLAFDISSRYKLTERMGDAFFGEERDDVAYRWQNSLQGDLVTMDLTFFLRREDGLYERFEERHVQRAHRQEEMEDWLCTEGFCDVRVYGDRTLSGPGSQELRLHFTAKKQTEAQ